MSKKPNKPANKTQNTPQNIVAQNISDMFDEPIEMVNLEDVNGETIVTDGPSQEQKAGVHHRQDFLNETLAPYELESSLQRQIMNRIKGDDAAKGHTYMFAFMLRELQRTNRLLSQLENQLEKRYEL